MFKKIVKLSVSTPVVSRKAVSVHLNDFFTKIDSKDYIEKMTKSLGLNLSN